jgi:subtilisin family serine protease
MPEDLGFTGSAIAATTTDQSERIEAFADRVLREPQFRHLADDDGSKIYPALGVAVFRAPPAELEPLAKEFTGISVGPDRFLRVPPGGSVPASSTHADILGAMNVKDSPSGAVKVAVLDSGFGTHPDFTGRTMYTSCFAHGGSCAASTKHGTHCIGLACGPLRPADGSARYGIAYGSTILNGRIVGPNNLACDCAIIAGIDWAREQQAAVVNISAGAAPFGSYSSEMQTTARFAMKKGLLIVAAAGNDTEGTGNLPISHPANCPSIMAVAALDHNLKPWKYSCVSVKPDQLVDIAAPGEMIRSIRPMSGYVIDSGTSQAAALVSGIAALWAAVDVSNRGQILWDLLKAKAYPMPGYEPRVGKGRVQAP